MKVLVAWKTELIPHRDWTLLKMSIMGSPIVAPQLLNDGWRNLTIDNPSVTYLYLQLLERFFERFHY